jgi:hypothetical protein
MFQVCGFNEGQRWRLEGFLVFSVGRLLECRANKSSKPSLLISKHVVSEQQVTVCFISIV